VILQLFVTKHL